MTTGLSSNVLCRLGRLVLVIGHILRRLSGYSHVAWRRIWALGWGRLLGYVPPIQSPLNSSGTPLAVVPHNDSTRIVVNAGEITCHSSISASALPTELCMSQSPLSDGISELSYVVKVDSPISMQESDQLPSHFEDTSESITLNDISLQRISLPLGTREAVVTPCASVVHLGHEVANPDIHETSFTSKEEISSVIYPIMPIDIARYDRQRVIHPEAAEYRIRSREGDFSPGELPAGWRQLIHPEGQPFFHHEEKNILTEVWLRDATLFRTLTEFIDHIEDFIRSRNLHRSLELQLVLELTKDDDDVDWCGYYFVDHHRRSLFWLEEFIVGSYMREVKGKLSPSHIKIYLETQYWKHWDIFPNVHLASLDVLDLVTDTIRDAQTDVLTSLESTINHSFTDLTCMMDIVKDSRDCANSGRMCSSWFIGRFMNMLWNDRFLNFHGQYGARLSRKQSIHGQKPEDTRHSYFIKFLSLILFYAPDVHLTTMEGLWVDKLTLKPHWTEFFTKLNTEWSEHTAFATILLNANVAFLAIPSNDTNDNGRHSSPVQIVSYLSIVTSVASIILGLLLVRQHRTREKGSATEVAAFLNKRNHRTRGLETLAIMYSLPYALLMWGMVTFLAAFLIMCFQSTSVTTQCVIGVAWSLTAALVLWCIQMSWEESETHWWDLFSHTWGRVTGNFTFLLRVQDRGGDEERDIDSVQEKTESTQPSTLRRFWPIQKSLHSDPTV